MTSSHKLLANREPCTNLRQEGLEKLLNHDFCLVSMEANLHFMKNNYIITSSTGFGGCFIFA